MTSTFTESVVEGVAPPRGTGWSPRHGLLLHIFVFTLYAKDEMADLTRQQRKALKAMIKAELEARRSV